MTGYHGALGAELPWAHAQTRFYEYRSSTESADHHAKNVRELVVTLWCNQSKGLFAAPASVPVRFRVIVTNNRPRLDPTQWQWNVESVDPLDDMPRLRHGDHGISPRSLTGLLRESLRDALPGFVGEVRLGVVRGYEKGVTE